MNHKQAAPLFLIMLLAVHLGFDWGAPKQTKSKAAPVVSQTQQQAPAVGKEPTLSQMMSALTQNLILWPSLSTENKKQAVEAAKLFYRDTQNAAILRTADFYAQQIDDGLRANAEMRNVDLLTILRMMSIVEYDFYHGQNKDALVKEVLGEAGYENLKTR